jgi:hypothetical protein
MAAQDYTIDDIRRMFAGRGWTLDAEAIGPNERGQYSIRALALGGGPASGGVPIAIGHGLTADAAAAHCWDNYVEKYGRMPWG